MRIVVSAITGLSILFYYRFDDDLDEVEEEDHFEDVDELEVTTGTYSWKANHTNFSVIINFNKFSWGL